MGILESCLCWNGWLKVWLRRYQFAAFCFIAEIYEVRLGMAQHKLTLVKKCVNDGVNDC